MTVCGFMTYFYYKEKGESKDEQSFKPHKC